MELAENLAKRETIDNGERWRRSRHAAARAPADLDPLATDPAPDEVDEAAWRMIPLLRAAEVRWAATVSPPHAETPPPHPWPFLSGYGLGNTNENFLPPPP
jgi:hypothetical protein